MNKAGKKKCLFLPCPSVPDAFSRVPSPYTRSRIIKSQKELKGSFHRGKKLIQIQNMRDALAES